MFVLLLGMVLSLGLAMVVVGAVVVPARREGRDVLTPKGEYVVTKVRDKTGSAVETALEKTGEAVVAAREKTGEAMGAAREKVADVVRSNEP